MHLAGRPRLGLITVALAGLIGACGTTPTTPPDVSGTSTPTPLVSLRGTPAITSAAPAASPAPASASASAPAAGPTPTPSPTLAPAPAVLAVHAPIVGFRPGRGVGTVAPVEVGFLITHPELSDPLGPPSSFRLEVSRDGGPFTSALSASGMGYSVGDPRQPSIPGLPARWPSASTGDWFQTGRTAALAGTYRYRAQAQYPGVHGGWSAWAAGPTIRVRALSETSPVWQYSAGWSPTTGARLVGGGAEQASAAGAVAAATFSGSSIAWVSQRWPGGGSAEVRVDGELMATVSLYSAASPQGSGPTIVFAHTWPTPGAHTLSITVLGTPGHPGVTVDELLDIR
jgi:hypothetical protein